MSGGARLNKVQQKRFGFLESVTVYILAFHIFSLSFVVFARKSYLVIGWMITAVSLAVMGSLPLETMGLFVC